MSLFTEEQTRKLLENGHPDNSGKDHPPVAMLTLPGTACCWLLSEIDPDNQVVAFGLCDLGFGFPELGSVGLDELERIKHPVFKTKVFMNPLFEAKYPMSVYAAAAREYSKIVWNDQLLKPHDLRIRKP